MPYSMTKPGGGKAPRGWGRFGQMSNQDERGFETGSPCSEVSVLPGSSWI